MGQVFQTLSMIWHKSLYFICVKLRLAAEYFGGDNNMIPTFTMNTKYYSINFYAFKMVASIAYLCKNTVERFKNQFS